MNIVNLLSIVCVLVSAEARSQETMKPADSANRTRLTDFSEPHLYTCYMEMYRGFSKNPKMGTGFLIHPRVILTAGHNVAYYPTGRVKQVDAFFGSIDDSTYRAKETLRLRRRKNKFFKFSYCMVSTLSRDFAIVILPDSSVYKQLGGHYKLDVLTSERLKERTDSISLTGSPMDMSPHEIWTETKSGFGVYDEKCIKACLYTRPRNSGSPVWYHYNNALYVAGVHSRGNTVTCCGTHLLMNQKVVDKIEKWCSRAGISL